MLRLLTIASLCIAGCATQPPVRSWTSGERNACVPEAAVMVEGLHGAGISARVLLITTPAWRHAVAVYLYPQGANQLWVWDATWSSVRVLAYYDNPDQVARAWVAVAHTGATVTAAEFLEICK